MTPTPTFNMKLTKSKLASYMQKYADEFGKKLNRAAWKRIKGLTVDPHIRSLEIVSNNQKYILQATDSTQKVLRFSNISYPGIEEFFEYIFTHEHNMTTSTLADTLSSVSSSAIATSNAINSLSTTLEGMNIGYSWQQQPTIATISTDTDRLDREIRQIKTDINELKKEKNTTMFNFDFGKITTDNVRISMYGIAVKSVDGHYVSYDAKTHSVMDVEILNMPAGDFLYKMPVAIKDIKAGDVVIHNRVPMFVVETHESTMKVIDIREGTEKEIYLTKSPFGFNFATKVVSLMDMCGAKADESNPFGNMLPFMLLGDGKNIDPMMMLMLANGGKMDMSNPMMMYFLMKDKGGNDMLPFLMMGMQTK